MWNKSSEISETVTQLKNSLESFGKELCLATKMSDVICRTDWKRLENWKEKLRCTISLCRLHESIIREQFPTKYKWKDKEDGDSIYGNARKQLIEYPQGVAEYLNVRSTQPNIKSIAEYRGQFKVLCFEQYTRLNASERVPYAVCQECKKPIYIPRVKVVLDKQR